MSNIAYTAENATTTANPLPGVSNMVTVATVRMRRGFETLTMEITDVSYTLPNGRVTLKNGQQVTGNGQHVAAWLVEAGTVYHTARGGMVGGDAGRSFGSEQEARDYANGWFAHLASKGWKRIA